MWVYKDFEVVCGEFGEDGKCVGYEGFVVLPAMYSEFDHVCRIDGVNVR